MAHQRAAGPRKILRPNTRRFGSWLKRRIAAVDVEKKGVYLIIPRTGKDTDEIFIYFVAVLKRGQIVVDPTELDSYIWSDEVTTLGTSKITRRLILGLLSIDYTLL
jgi:hypothetical protein